MNASTGHIVDASGSVINKHKPQQLRKQLVSSKVNLIFYFVYIVVWKWDQPIRYPHFLQNIGEPVRVVECIGQDGEMKFIVDKIKQHRTEHHMKYGDFAILYRVNETGKDVRKQLKAVGIPFCTQVRVSDKNV